MAVLGEVNPAVQPLASVRAHKVYLEVLAQRKALHVLGAVDTTLLELVDGPGAPPFNTVLMPLAGAPGPPPTTLRAITGAQGVALWNLLLPLIAVPAGP